MAFCNQCGRQAEEGSVFCSYCGAPLDPALRTVGKKPKKTARAEKTWNSFRGVLFRYSDTTFEYKEADREQNRYISLVSYLSVLVLVPLVSMKESPFTQYHANVGLNLLIWEFLFELLGLIIRAFLGWIPVLGILLEILAWLIRAVFAAISVFGIVSAVKGKARELQILRPFKIMK